jgi:prepilin-type N-terminal cleavage/methylation domain-containing protein
MCAFKRREQGFSLVEVMVAMVIFLVASMGLLPLLMTNMQANQGNLLHAQARRLAGETMAVLQVVDYALLDVAADDVLQAGGVEVRQTVEADTPVLDQSRITVTALWRQRGQQHRYQLQTIRTAP